MLALEAISSVLSTLRAPSLEGSASLRFARATFPTLSADVCSLPLAGLRVASNRHAMARDDDDFRLRPGKIRDHSGERTAGRRVRLVRARPTSFAGQIQQAIRRAGGNPSRLNGAGKGSGRFNARGRGAAVAAALKSRNAWSRDGGVRTRSRRVAVKARVVKLNPQRGGARGRQFVGAKAVDAHLRYLQRDGVTKDGEKAQVYSADRDVEDGCAFVERGRAIPGAPLAANMWSFV